MMEERRPQNGAAARDDAEQRSFKRCSNKTPKKETPLGAERKVPSLQDRILP